MIEVWCLFVVAIPGASPLAATASLSFFHCSFVSVGMVLEAEAEGTWWRQIRAVLLILQTRYLEAWGQRYKGSFAAVLQLFEQFLSNIDQSHLGLESQPDARYHGRWPRCIWRENWGQRFGCASRVRVVLDLSGTFDVAAKLIEVEQSQSLVVQAMLKEGRPLGAAVALTGWSKIVLHFFGSRFQLCKEFVLVA
jgi:hypothetical protein